MDGHKTHVTADFINLCINNQVTLISLPTHTSYILQPLDLGVFSPYQRYYGDKVYSRAFRSHTAIDKIEFLNIITEVRRKAVTIRNVKGGWRVSGIVPFNIQKVLN